ncbi:MAG TPA: TRAP transporter small permease [Desulfatirhabdiaceae bacterium]|nr:TRAP transporter small permease [Desulfatirhabdiaceae bacterium]
MTNIDTIISWLSDKLKNVGAFCLTAMMLITCVDVVGRFFNTPILGAVEFVGFFFTLTTAFALPYTNQMDAHIGVELVVTMLPQKHQELLRLITTLTSFLLFCLVTWRMTIYADTIHQSGEVSMTLKLPEYVIIYVVALCFLVFSLILIQDVLKLIKKSKSA